MFSEVATSLCSNIFSWSVYVERVWIKCVMIPKLSMIRAVHCSLLKKDPTSDSVHIMEECSSGPSEENPVQDTLAALLAHSQSCRMKSTVELN